MNLCENLILAKGKVITPEVETCRYNTETNKYEVRFYTGKVYTYNCNNITWMKNPVLRNPEDYEITHNGTLISKITAIYEFEHDHMAYWHLCLENNRNIDYEKNDLDIVKSCLSDTKTKTLFTYLKQTADHVSLKTDDGTMLLSKQFETIDFIGADTIFSTYVHPEKFTATKSTQSIPIFPFGCNASQYTAVKTALDNKISIIEGPPGTGKTQTILNIVANLVASGKTVQIVSSNNSATANIFEKMSSYDLDFMIAPLGKSENKARFIKNQKNTYPEKLQSWKNSLLASKGFSSTIQYLSAELQQLYKNQEKLYSLKQDLQNLETEYQYFLKYIEETNNSYTDIKIRREIRPDVILNLWHECQRYYDRQKTLSFIFTFKCRFLYGIATWMFYQKNAEVIIAFFQYLFYTMKRSELIEQIDNKEKRLANDNMEKKSNELHDLSMKYFKNYLFEKYGSRLQRKIFTSADLSQNYRKIIEEYPVILSSAFSSRSSLCTHAQFDYIIIDEASQVDIVTGALALSCAKNAVIVGDRKQLPNVITEENKKTLQTIFNSYRLDPAYNCAQKSILQSMCDIIPCAPQTLLREHYRCHPQIINFCNQKFYHGNLIIMTKDNGEKDVISVIKTVTGNHCRDRMNQRQIDVITGEILPSLPYAAADIGIITPYKNQVEAIANATSSHDIEVATINKFQGREKDAIIISTVDNVLSSFSDDPSRLNVAVSRARKCLRLVVSGNEQQRHGNINDLIDYIAYHNFTIAQSSVRSVFDLLYSSYTKQRHEVLNSKKRISAYDSENLLYTLITEVLQNDNFSGLQVICHLPLNMLIKDFTRLATEERRYAMNYATHVDFLIYNHITKKPVLAIEVDGYRFHKKGTAQAQRDQKKDHILELYDIPLLRLATNGSGEKEKIIQKLNEVSGP
jgi:hypothetical protein